MNRSDQFVELLKERPLVLDGAMGTNIQTMGLTLEEFGSKDGCNEYLTLTKPSAIETIHASFLEVGADALKTNTFGSGAIVLAEYQLQDQVFELNAEAVKLARRVADRFSTSSHPRFVLGSMGPGTKLVSLGHVGFADLQQVYCDQVKGLLVDGGADVLLLETCQDLLQVKAGLTGALKAFEEGIRKAPILVHITIETTGTMLMGSDVAAALAALEPYHPFSIGLNCSTGPESMIETIRYLAENYPGRVSCVPNAGLPENVGGKAVYRLSPDDFAKHLSHFVHDFGVDIVGGCCGTTPQHIAALVQAIKKKPRYSRSPAYAQAVSSLYSAVELKQEPRPLIVGERTNANGSRIFKGLLEKEDYDGLVSIGREQIKEGAHVLDLCVAFVGRDEVRDMRETVKRFATQVALPLMIDSTESPAIEVALQHLGGKSIVNSINFEDGMERVNKVMPLVKRYGGGVVALTIDEQGMAKTAERKFEIAKRLYEVVTQTYGIHPANLLIDPLTFTLGSGDEEFRKAGVETLEAIKMIKARLPGALTLLGLSNISFGLDPITRVILNSVFLHEALGAGLDAAIMNAKHIKPWNKLDEQARELARQLVFDERREGYDPLTLLMARAKELSGQAAVETVKHSARATTVEEQLKAAIVDGERKGLEAMLEAGLKKYTALQIINDVLLGGMAVVGELFGKGEMQLPFVLQSAEVMKTAVKYLEPHMDKLGGPSKGKIVLATVKGDVHDIGKNLVDIILTNNGYQTYNLGIKVPIQRVIDAMKEHQADAVGLSGLLVKSTVVMKEDLETLNDLQLAYPVILGGAALTRKYVEDDLRSVYRAPLFYAVDAFSGLDTMGRIMKEKREGGVQVPAPVKHQAARASSPSPLAGEGRGEGKVAVRSQVRADVAIPTPPFWGTKVVTDIPVTDLFPFVNETVLFRGRWQFKRGKMTEEDVQRILQEKAIPAYEALKRRCLEEGTFEPKVVYGYFPCQSQGNDLIVYRDDRKTEWVRFSFPRQPSNPHLCLADFFASVESGRMDVAPFQLVTIGRKATAKGKELFAANQYTDYLYLHGLSVEMAEALAEYVHKRVRAELGVGGEDSPTIQDLFVQKYRGSRFSFGYPACPNLEDHVQLFTLLDPKRIDVELTEEFQLDPEQSTDALVVVHPEAKWFSVRPDVE